MKVRQYDACLRDSVVLPYISVLLGMKFMTPEIPFLLTNCSFITVEVPVHSSQTGT